MNRFTTSGMFIALLLGGLGTLHSTHAQTTSPQACGDGELLMVSANNRLRTEVVCVDASILLDRLCLEGEILQRGQSALRCAANNDVAPDVSTSVAGLSARCGIGEVVTAMSNGLPSMCGSIERVLSDATAACADGNILRFVDGELRCSDYLGLNATTSLSPSVADGTTCANGQVLQRDANGMPQCKNIAAVLASALSSCANDDTIVFDADFIPVCGKTLTCGVGQLAVLTSTGMQCRDVGTALRGLCIDGEILQKANGVMQCASNDGNPPDGNEVPQNNQQSSTENGAEVCNTNQVATREADGSIGCTNIGQLIDTMANPCATGQLLRFDDDGLRCNDYGNGTPTAIAAKTPVASAAQACAAGHVLQLTASGLQCASLATMLEDAFGDACGADETIVFGTDGAASCSKALTTCPADTLEWTSLVFTCQAEVEESDLGFRQEFTDDEGPTEGSAGLKGRATFACSERDGESGAEGYWEGPLGTKQCVMDTKVCKVGSVGEAEGYRCAAESPGQHWRELPRSERYCMTDGFQGYDDTRSCYALIAPPMVFFRQTETDSSITIAWSEVDHAESYHVQWYAGSKCSGTPLGSDDVTDTVATATGLESDQRYYISVAARRHGELGGSTCFPYWTSITKPTVPGNLRVASKTISSLELSWDASTSERVPSYELRQYSDASCSEDEVSHGLGKQTTKTLTGLIPGTTYYFTVRASDLPGGAGQPPDPRGNSDWHECVAATTVPLTHCPAGRRTWTVGGNACHDDVPQMPVGPDAIRLADGQGRNIDAPGLEGTAHLRCTVSGWSDPLENPAATCRTDTTMCITSDAGYTCSDTSPGAHWKAMSESRGYCPTSATSCHAHVPPPSNPRTAAVGDDFITAQWDVVPGAARYHINWHEGSTDCSSDESTNITAGGTMRAFTGLTPGKDYSFRVATERGGVRGDHTSCVSAATSVTPPSVPANMNLKNRWDTRITVKWNASASLRTPKYTVSMYESDNCTGTAQSRVTSATEETFGDLEEGRVFSFRVKASNLFDSDDEPDPRGDSGWSGCIHADTTVPPPPMPGNLRPKTLKYTSITMQWDASTPLPGWSVTYTLTRYEGSDCTGTGVSEKTTDTKFESDGLASNSNYSFQVKASYPSEGSVVVRDDSDWHSCVSATTTKNVFDAELDDIFDADTDDVVLWKRRIGSGYNGAYIDVLISDQSNVDLSTTRVYATDFYLYPAIPRRLLEGYASDSTGYTHTEVSHSVFNFNIAPGETDPMWASRIWINLANKTSRGDTSRSLVDEDNRAFCYRFIDDNGAGPQIYVPLAGKDDEFAFTQADLEAMSPSQAGAFRAIEEWVTAEPSGTVYLDVVLVALGPGFDADTLSLVERFE